MTGFKKNALPQIIVLAAVLLIVLCICLSIHIIEKDAKEECLAHIEETASQISDMFSNAMVLSQTQLSLFADILAANSSNPDELLESYMENFCDTQNFSAVCVHRANGTTFSYGSHPHEKVTASFADELALVPYISNAVGTGDTRSQQYVYLAEPVIRDGAPIAILYGYISLDVFPTFISSSAYGGKCQFYIADGRTGALLMDEYHRYDPESGSELPLGNVFDGSTGSRKTRPGYTLEAMQDGMRSGESGYFVFQSRQTGQWFYTYFMPMDINRWSMQITIDEPTAFEAYYSVRNTVVVMTITIIALCLVIIVVLVLLSRRKTAQEAQNLHRADYLNKVRSALLTAHSNPDFVNRALKLVAQEMGAEKALLLTFRDHCVSNIYYWPSLDMNQAKALIGVNIREEFPEMFDALSSDERFFCSGEAIDGRFAPNTNALFHALGVSSILLVPITDNTGLLKGAIATINMADVPGSPEMLTCVTRDFFMAITNLENHNIIKQMGTMDYLTGIKNRNSYEAELMNYETAQADSLWCLFVDANGLHELNNSQGHTAGDTMLRTVAETMKKIFGPDCCYRLGGDEFVAFRMNGTHKELMACKYRLLDTLSRKGYSVSAGFEGAGKNENQVFDVETIVARAEKLMYQEKWKYYAQSSTSPDRKHPPSEP